MKSTTRAVAVLLTAALLFSLLSGCMRLYLPGVSPPAASSVPVSAETTSENTPVESTPAATVPASPERGQMPDNGITWRQLFWDQSLPEDGWLGEGEACFYTTDEAGRGSVTLLSIDQLLEFSSAMEPLPRTHYYEQYLGDRFRVLMAAFDYAMAKGSRKFSFSTAELEMKDVRELLIYLELSFPISNSKPQFTASKEYVGADGQRFRYLTALFRNFEPEDMKRIQTATERARKIVEEMPEGLDELDRAKYLYRYVATHCVYDERAEGYYDQRDWNSLYDALIKECAVCTGFAEAIYCLFNLAGIDCLYVLGEIRPEDPSVGAVGHAWNLAKVNGDWYIFDATWDSTGKSSVYAPLYFGLSTEAMNSYADRRLTDFLKEHTPVCDKILDPDYLYALPNE